MWLDNYFFLHLTIACTILSSFVWIITSIKKVLKKGTTLLYIYKADKICFMSLTPTPTHISEQMGYISE